MNLFDEIAQVRDAGRMIAMRLEKSFSKPEEAAPRFGLLALAEAYEEIPAEEAAAVLANVIHKDMAYGVELVSFERAQKLAKSFLESFPLEGTRYFTNGSFGRPRGEKNTESWWPVTDATLDTGVLVIGQSSTGCLWFTDED
ncbi:hypothetical protein VDS18_07285 [Xanthomonas campestris pv. campestris]|nr:hypothetical protein [Xanthomonas campestris pv. campestris]